jgi:hypothetical protein
MDVGGNIHKKEYVKCIGKLQSFGFSPGGLCNNNYALKYGSPNRGPPGIIMRAVATFVYYTMKVTQ